MKYSKELIDIVKKREFKTFWHCLDYLLMAGYPILDAFGITMQEFGEPKIFSDVAFVRNEPRREMYVDQGRYQQELKDFLVIGLIDESNIHLSGLYTVYRKWLHEDKLSVLSEIEDTCEIIKVANLSRFVIEYLHSVSVLHFGIEVFKLPEFEKFKASINPILPQNIQQLIGRYEGNR